MINGNMQMQLIAEKEKVSDKLCGFVFLALNCSTEYILLFSINSTINSDGLFHESLNHQITLIYGSKTLNLKKCRLLV